MPQSDVRRHVGAIAAAATAALLLGAVTRGQIADEVIELEHPAIAYSRPAIHNPVARLSDQVASGRITLRFDQGSGYLKSVLAALDVPAESQLAVFSRASLQSRIIRPDNPRTIFFNDAVAVAWVRGGFVEIAAQDAEKGAVFFRVMQTPGVPTFFRDNSCLGCHNGATTLGIPGFIARSVPSASDGSIMPWLGNHIVDHRTPVADRWGGMYVTGRTGAATHLGNAPLANKRLQTLGAADRGPVLDTLQGRFDSYAYLSPHSDVVALLIFDHQVHMMNLLSRLGAEARLVAADDRAAATRLERAVTEVVDYMLFVDEARLSGASGTSGFAKVFSARGPRDSKGRSLRDLDLRARLMRYPCSYMIYSETFDGLPPKAKAGVFARLKRILNGQETGRRYASLSAADRTAVLEILRETKRDF